MEPVVKKTYCENCGKELKGRSDKRFCDDSCRNTFNHRQRVPDNEVMLPVINILKKNRSILMDAFESKTRVVSKMQLAERGYNFNFCTERKTLGGSDYYFCFDYGYEILKEGKYEVISAGYFEFIYAAFLSQWQNYPKPDYNNPDDVAFYETMIEPLRINSELKDPPNSNKRVDPGLTIIE